MLFNGQGIVRIHGSDMKGVYNGHLMSSHVIGSILWVIFWVGSTHMSDGNRGLLDNAGQLDSAYSYGAREIRPTLE